MKIATRFAAHAATAFFAVTVAASIGKATPISFFNVVPLQGTDILDVELPMTPFIPGTNGIPTNAVLRSYTIKYEEQVKGQLSLTLTSGSVQTVRGVAETYGAVFLFGPTPAHDLEGGHLGDSVTDDVFGGNGPTVSQSVKASLSAGQTSTPVQYDIIETAVSGAITSNLNLVEKAWSAYVDSGTVKMLTISGGGKADINIDSKVGGKVTVTYDYDIVQVPEPATTAMIGGALIGAVVLRKRLSGRRTA